MPTAETCESTGCPLGEMCVGGTCQPVADDCATSGCATGETCVAGVCVPPAGTTRLGEPCVVGTDCASGACGMVAGESLCTQLCPCPGGFECEATGLFCVPSHDADVDAACGPGDDCRLVGGCTMRPGQPGSSWAGVLVVTIAAVLVRQRRRGARHI